MRLLKRTPDGEIQLISADSNHPPPYVILSHTWNHGQEVTYQELVAGTGMGKSGYDKIRFCVDRAAKDSIEYSWVDTCCIDKSTSDELSTAINSMFRWYQGATKCYVYLSDVEVLSDAQEFCVPFRQSKWFTRGWTLQELLAPAAVEFFSKEGRLLGSRLSLERDIHDITGIPIGALRGQRLAEFSVEERMRWAAGRSTTMTEDIVYCLFGLFEVFLPLIYGEGAKHASVRLKMAIRDQQVGEGIERPHDLAGMSKLGET